MDVLTAKGVKEACRLQAPAAGFSQRVETLCMEPPGGQPRSRHRLFRSPLLAAILLKRERWNHSSRRSRAVCRGAVDSLYCMADAITAMYARCTATWTFHIVARKMPPGPARAAMTLSTPIGRAVKKYSCQRRHRRCQSESLAFADLHPYLVRCGRLLVEEGIAAETEARHDGAERPREEHGHGLGDGDGEVRHEAARAEQHVGGQKQRDAEAPPVRRRHQVRLARLNLRQRHRLRRRRAPPQGGAPARRGRGQPEAGRPEAGVGGLDAGAGGEAGLRHGAALRVASYGQDLAIGIEGIEIYF